MRAAVASLDPEPEIREALEAYFETAAESMRNRF
jgi:truncated hemoglobin YjbI